MSKGSTFVCFLFGFMLTIPLGLYLGGAIGILLIVGGALIALIPAYKSVKAMMTADVKHFNMLRRKYELHTHCEARKEMLLLGLNSWGK